jgi:hypothetical protein
LHTKIQCTLDKNVFEKNSEIVKIYIFLGQIPLHSFAGGDKISIFFEF